MEAEPLAGVVAATATEQPRADALAGELVVPLLAAPPTRGLFLVVEPGGLGLLDGAAAQARPLRVDLVGGSLGARLLRQPGRKDPLARAIGATRGRPAPRVLDATAGLLRDAAVLACIGCQVVAAERQPVLAALAADGLRRARTEPRLAGRLERLMLHAGDARDWLRARADEVDVVILDPMFPERHKAALVKQPMRWLRRLAGADEDAFELLQQARERCPRVVVKRPRHAPSLAPGPTAQIDAGQVRFDVWLRPAGG